MNLKGRDFLTLKDFSKEEIMYLIDLAAELKDKKKKGIPVDHHRGKNVALIFEKTSTRTYRRICGSSSRNVWRRRILRNGLPNTDIPSRIMMQGLSSILRTSVAGRIPDYPRMNWI